MEPVQVVISGKLERIARVKAEAPLGQIGIHNPHCFLLIRTSENRQARVKFCNEFVPFAFKGEEVLYIHDVNRGQSLMVGKLSADENNAGISLESPKILGVIPSGISPIVRGDAPRYLGLDYFYNISDN